MCNQSDLQRARWFIAAGASIFESCAFVTRLAVFIWAILGCHMLAYASREWTIETSLETRYFTADPEQPFIWPSVANMSVGPRYSPDHRHFFFITHTGDIKTDTNRYRLWVYSTERVASSLRSGHGPIPRSLAPTWSVEQDSTDPKMFFPGSGAISCVQWETNNTLLFLRGTGRNRKIPCRLDVRTGKITEIAPEDSFDGVPQISGGSVLYAIESQQNQSIAPAYPAQYAHAEHLMSILAGENHQLTSIYAGFNFGTPRLVRKFESRFGAPILPSLSPNGRWGIVALPAYSIDRVTGIAEIPDAWIHYEGIRSPSTGFYDRDGGADYSDYARLWRLALIDMETSELRVVFDAPLGEQSTAPVTPGAKVLWSKDSERVVLVNICLPMAEKEPERSVKKFLVEFEISTGRWRQVLEMRAAPGNSERSSIASIRWIDAGNELEVAFSPAPGGTAESEYYVRGRDGWLHKTLAAPPENFTRIQEAMDQSFDLRVLLKGNANSPHEMVAIIGDQQVSLTGPDPALQGVMLTPTRLVEFSQEDGSRIRAGLLLPDESICKAPWPLVIQIESTSTKQIEESFSPDGAASGPYAAQLLASHGFAVLRISGNRKISETPLEHTRNIVRQIDTVVESLAKEGLVYPKRVGLVGFSRNGGNVYSAISHPGKVVPAAAITADNFNASYISYTLFGALLERFEHGTREFEEIYGGSPWTNIESWVSNAPGFSAGKVDTPLLLSEYNANWSVAFGAGEAIGSLRLNRREVDLMIIPAGDHQLVLPKQRAAALQSTLDWMMFWLQDREIDPGQKLKQYAYWRALKRQRDERWAKEGNPYDKLGQTKDDRANLRGQTSIP